jgi:hypothetical protein
MCVPPTWAISRGRRSAGVADAPQTEADDQHAEEDAQHDVFGVFAELIHGAGWVVGGVVVGVLIGAHAYHLSVPGTGNQAGL